MSDVFVVEKCPHDLYSVLMAFHTMRMGMGTGTMGTGWDGDKFLSPCSSNWHSTADDLTRHINVIPTYVYDRCLYKKVSYCKEIACQHSWSTM